MKKLLMFLMVVSVATSAASTYEDGFSAKCVISFSETFPHKGNAKDSTVLLKPGTTKQEIRKILLGYSRQIGGYVLAGVVIGKTGRFFSDCPDVMTKDFLQSITSEDGKIHITISLKEKSTQRMVYA